MHFGIGMLPYAGAFSIHQFIGNRVSLGLDMNVGYIQATENFRTWKKYGTGPNASYAYTYDSRKVNSAGVQLGLMMHIHLKKAPKKNDAYLALGAHLVKADNSILDIESDYKYGNSYLASTTNFFLPVSMAIGWRWNHTKKLSVFTEIGLGTCLAKFGLYYKIK